MFGHRKKEKSYLEARIEQLPEPIFTFANGEPFPAERHLRALDWIARTSYYCGDEQGETMARLCLALSRVLADMPHAEDPTTMLFDNVYQGHVWLENQGLAPQSAAFTEAWKDMLTYWAESGAISRLNEKCREEEH